MKSKSACIDGHSQKSMSDGSWLKPRDSWETPRITLLSVCWKCKQPPIHSVGSECSSLSTWLSSEVIRRLFSHGHDGGYRGGRSGDPDKAVSGQEVPARSGMGRSR